MRKKNRLVYCFGTIAFAGFLLIESSFAFVITGLERCSYTNNSIKPATRPEENKEESSANLSILKDSEPEYITYNFWDFENETLGRYSDDLVREDFDIVNLWSHNSASIVIDTINNSPTKVLKAVNEPNLLWTGFQLNVKLDKVYKEVYMSYNLKFGEEWNSTAGGKLPGLRGFPEVSNGCPTSGEGFIAMNMFKLGGRIISYHYDRTYSSCPWSTEEYKYHNHYFANGTWYNITQRLVLNTFTNGNPNADGIKELWIDGKLIFQETNLKIIQDQDKGIDGAALSIFYGGDSEGYMPLYESDVYLDNIRIYMPINDPVIDRKLHSTYEIYTTPDEITNRAFFYDKLVSNQGKVSNTEYGSLYSSCIDEAYLIDAGEDKTVRLNIEEYSIGGGDFLFFYDGNTSDANLLEVISGHKSGKDKIINSTGRYLFVRFSTNTETSAAGWTGSVSFYDKAARAPAAPSSLISKESTHQSITIQWNDNSTNESGFLIERTLASEASNRVTVEVNANDTLYVDEDLLPSTTYVYSVQAVNQAGSSPSSNKSIVSTLSVAETKRIKDGLIAYYNFNYDPDFMVRDLSGFRSPLDLKVLQRSSVSWDNNNKLKVTSATALVSLAPADKIISAVKTTNAFSAECWIIPSESGLLSTSRIVSLGKNDNEVGFVLDQECGNDGNRRWLNYSVRTQTNSTTITGFPQLIPINEISSVNLIHLAYTIDQAGYEAFYINGKKQAEGFRPSGFENWSDTYYLRFGNESDLSKPYKGSLYSIALFNRALSASEINYNCSVGPTDNFDAGGFHFQLRIFPNPATEQATIEITPDESVITVHQTRIRLLDIYGRVFHEETLFNSNGKYTKILDLKRFIPGMYFIQVLSGKQQSTAKLTVN